ncbi:protealysin inhibitor emfourin [Nocardia sp. NPDC004654]|uniref:protealysin inhibitor emfourin n=1 Tax=Nocardia sp. NPDC004654 TaxID=3154776 RepID=UPI0033AD56BF
MVAVKVTLTTSGGHVPGLPARPTIVDSAALAAADADRLARAVAAAVSADDTALRTFRAPDAATYRLTIETADGTDVLVGSDGALSPALAELLDVVEQLGEPS